MLVKRSSGIVLELQYRRRECCTALTRERRVIVATYPAPQSGTKQAPDNGAE